MNVPAPSPDAHSRLWEWGELPNIYTQIVSPAPRPPPLPREFASAFCAERSPLVGSVVPGVPEVRGP